MSYTRPHSCFVVEDLEAAVSSFSDRFDVGFRRVARLPFRLDGDGRSFDQVLEVTYTLDGAVELVQAADRGPFDRGTSLGFHHLGYTASDFAAAVAHQEQAGMAVEWRMSIAGAAVAALLVPAGARSGRIELLNAAAVAPPGAWDEHHAPGTGDVSARRR